MIAMRYRILLALGLIAALAGAAAAFYRQALFGGSASANGTDHEATLKSTVRIEDQPDSTAFLSAISEVQRRIAARMWTPPPVPAAELSDEPSGDERLPMAFDLLRRHKPEAATRLLQAVADDRLTRSKQERADAIVAYRTLGAIARDPQQALQAFAHAIELDPNDVDSLIGGGWIVLQQGAPGEAERRLRRAMPLVAGDAQPWNRFRVTLGLGHVREQRGEFQDALAFYRDALAIARREREAGVDDADWQRALSLAYQKTGDVYGALGSLSEALQAYRDGLAIADRLARSEPASAAWQSTVSMLSIKIGDVLAARQDLPGTLAAYTDALGIATRLAGDNTEGLIDLAVCDEKAGDARLAMGDAADALTFYRAAIGIRSARARSVPADTSRQRDLAASLSKAGDALLAERDLSAALSSYNEAFAIADRLVQSDLHNNRWLHDLAGFLRKVGAVHAARGESLEALKSQRDALAIIDHLAKAEPGNEDWQHDLFVAYETVGNLLYVQGNRTGASDSYRSGLLIAEALAASAPGDAGRQAELRDAYDNTGGTLIARGEVSAGLDFLDDGRLISERLVRSDPDNRQWQHDYALVLNSIGDARMERGDTGGMQFYRDALAIVERLVQSDPGNASWRQDALLTNWRLAAGGDDSLRRWKAVAASLRETRSHSKLTDQQAAWLASAEQQVAKLTPPP
jgi:tetratricopeptide (TPR) repeat protein